MPILRCPDCSSSDIIKAGIKHLRKRKTQRFMCKKCGHYFYVKSPKKIIRYIYEE